MRRGGLLLGLRAGGFELLDGVFDRIAFGAHQLVVIEINRQHAQIFHHAVAGDIKGVVPTVGMEGVAQERRAEQKLHLVAAHAWLQ